MGMQVIFSVVDGVDCGVWVDDCVHFSNENLKKL